MFLYIFYTININFPTGSNFLLANSQIWDWPIVYANEGFCQVTGISRAEMMTHSCVCEFMHGHLTSVDTVNRMREGLEKQLPSRFELLLYDKQGKMRNILGLNDFTTTQPTTTIVKIFSFLKRFPQFQEGFSPIAPIFSFLKRFSQFQEGFSTIAPIQLQFIQAINCTVSKFRQQTFLFCTHYHKGEFFSDKTLKSFWISKYYSERLLIYSSNPNILRIILHKQHNTFKRNLNYFLTKS